MGKRKIGWSGQNIEIERGVEPGREYEQGTDRGYLDLKFTYIDIPCVGNIPCLRRGDCSSWTIRRPPAIVPQRPETRSCVGLVPKWSFLVAIWQIWSWIDSTRRDRAQVRVCSLVPPEWLDPVARSGPRD